jgi:hypothetical protein
MRKEKLLAIMVFLSLVAENSTVLAYYDEMWTPARLFEWFTEPLSIKVTIFEIACLVMLLVTRRKGPVARPVVTAIRVSAATLVFCIAYGLALGGEVKPIYTQGIAWAFCLVFSLSAMTVLSTAEDFRLVENAIVWAAIWRSCMAIIFYLKVRGRDWQTMPQHMTTHEDTVLFVVGLLILASRAIEMRTRQALRHLLLATPLVMLAIQFNNRRLAWATLAMGLLILYAMLPAKSPATRRLNRRLLIASPFIVLYVAIGWGRPEKIFKPLQSFESMGGSGAQVDNSTKARENENASLIAMVKERPVLGTGLGHEWQELDSTFTVPLTVFPMYHYCPHNNVLALLAFTGGLGFAGLWMVIPVSVFFNARTYRRARDPAVRSVAVMGLVEAAAYLNQAYGDMGAMGVTHIPPATILGVGVAAAARLSTLSGAWPVPGRTTVR